MSGFISLPLDLALNELVGTLWVVYTRLLDL